MLSYTTHLNSPEKPWVTFVHGAGGSSTIWFKQIRPFKEAFNVLLIDLRGHGNSKKAKKTSFNYNFDLVTKDVLDVLDALQIKDSHFVGISLGTIIIRNITKLHKNRVLSMTMGGAIMKLDIRSQILIQLGMLFKSIIPYMLLYQFFAYIIMPRRNHRNSRKLFVKEARKLDQKEFIKWFKLTAEINPLLRYFRNTDPVIPTLYIMGKQDHLFLPSIQKITDSHKMASLEIIKKCGHVVNIERPHIFNKKVISFLTSVN
ncbi:alpha/beta hydrolase [Flavobacteriaceae bacterium]|nr:alpha/beta hydrolase [Flavobacteriaceae bacterium]